jgi:CRP/FNR family transcriptional regulator, cyclic AMP receptor protein
MNSLSGCEQSGDCQTCNLKKDALFCNLSPAASEEFAAIKYSSDYPVGSILFHEHADPRGIFILCSGQIKLSVSSAGGKTLIMRIAKPGDILGLTATMSGVAYEADAETLHPCRVAFIRRSDFLRFIQTHPEAYQAIIGQLSSQYTSACEQLRTIGLSTSAHEKLARLLLHWSSDGRQTQDGTQFKVPLTHEQIAECVGSTRETITRTLGDFKEKRLLTIKGSTMMIPNRAALEAVGCA